MFCSNKGPSPFQRGDNSKNVKVGRAGRGHLKILSGTTGPTEKQKFTKKKVSDIEKKRKEFC
jgi:hypothetical protein